MECPFFDGYARRLEKSTTSAYKTRVPIVFTKSVFGVFGEMKERDIGGK